ncbi:hypothetical protein ASG31_16600 [Chryseobacterium sp. Leaf404]|nr:hypothetical protein ASG31_16600 [Chryseobacterium sp. Leaf404]
MPQADTQISCICNDLEIYPYFYYKDPERASTSHLYLRFDFHHKGRNKCKPEFKGSITIYRSDDIQVTIPLNRLTSPVDNMGQRIFVITQLHLPDSFRPMTLGGNNRITYSLNYGIKSQCPTSFTKFVRFTTSEPIL